MTIPKDPERHLLKLRLLPCVSHPWDGGSKGMTMREYLRRAGTLWDTRESKGYMTTHRRRRDCR